MKGIKYIHCFGTSYTAGGGFEFDGVTPNDNAYTFYGDIDLPLTQYNFSYPGQLQKVLSDNVKVINHAKNGYGDERTFRLLYDIVNDSKFNKNEHIFIIEYAGLGRNEYWFNEINDYIVCNYWFDWNTGLIEKRVNIANSYGYQSHEMSDMLIKYEPLFLEFLENTLKLNNETTKHFRNIEFFASYLNQKQLNYFYTTNQYDHHIGKNFLFGDGIYFKKTTDFNTFSADNNLLILHETDFKYNDMHNGYIANKIIGLTIYNTLIDLGFFELKKVDIDWKQLRQFKLKNNSI